MLLTEKRLRAVIHDILLEGVREDAAALEVDLEDNPEALRQFQSLTTKPKWVNWLADRYLRQKYPVDDTLPDVLSLVVNFASKDAAISQKYGSNEQFKTAVDAAFGPPERRGWTSPADATKMSSSDMNTLLALHDRKKQRLEVDRADESWKQDKIGQFGPWALYFSTSQQNSINIAGADPVTLKGYTTWCTARTAGSNLFYNYAGRGIMLFYAIDESKPPTDAKSRISLGYFRGELNANGDHGGLTVDAKNSGLMMPDLQKIFGSNLSGILAAAEAVVKHHGAEHPAKAEFDVARQDAAKFKSMLSGLSDDEAGDLCSCILGDDSAVSAEVVLAAASHKSVDVRELIAPNRQTPPYVLEKLAADPNARVRNSVVRNRNTPPQALEKLVADPDASVRLAIVKYHWLRKLPPHALEKLADDSDVEVRVGVADIPFTPPHVLEKLAADAKWDVRARVAGNASTPLHVLEKMTADPEASVRYFVARNKKTPISVYEKLVSDPNENIRSMTAGRVARSRKARPEVLEQLSSSDLAVVTRAVARNPKTPLSALRALSQHGDDKTREAAQAALAKLQPMGEARRLAHRIIAELKRR